MRKTKIWSGYLSGKKMKAIMAACLFVLTSVFYLACSKSQGGGAEAPTVSPLVNVKKSFAVLPGKNVMMQAFYTDVPAGGTWWGVLQGKVSAWAGAGITSLWLPPSTKGSSGSVSNGYDPYDYFDFGDFNQKGTTETRYGSKTELQSLITASHSASLQVYADIVMNHNLGGNLEFNPNANSNTNTAFTPASGIFPRNYNCFHPSTYETADAGVFSNFPDLVHKNPTVAGGFWSNSNSVAKYYKNTMGYDGWRFDWVDGFAPGYVNSFVSAAPGFAVTEYWGPSGGTSVTEIQSCVTASGQSSFDFPAMFAMKNAFTNNNLALLSTTNMLCKANPAKAVTFVANHDVDYVPSANKLQAYAFILAHEGTPCIFYKDYEQLLDKAKMNSLIWINKNLAAGTTAVLYADNDEYVAKMSGSPGLIIYINTSGSAQSRQVTTAWANSNLHDFANNVTTDVSTNSSGLATITVPANSYSIWSANGSAAASITITLRMLKDVTSGYSLFFTGDNAALTNWGGGVQGIWSSGNYWSTNITVPATTTAINFKVRKGTTGGTGDTYESGSNHVINNPVNGTVYTVTFNGGF